MYFWFPEKNWKNVKGWIMKYSIAALFILAAALTAGVLCAEETNLTGTNRAVPGGAQVTAPEIVITADRYITPLADTGESVSVINEKEIREKGKTFADDLINFEPGVTLSRYGGLGGASVLSIRGAENGGTVVLIDGIPMNNPIVSQNGDSYFDFANMTPDNIGRIEIIRGPFSALYGSESMGGVVDIITKEGSGPPEGKIDITAGSFNTFKCGAGVSGGMDAFNYSLYLSHIGSDGFSHAVVTDETVTPPKNGYNNTTLSSKTVYKPFEGGKLSFVVHYNYADYFIPDGPFAPDDRNNYISSDAAFKLGFEDVLNSWWDYSASVCYLNSDVENSDNPGVYQSGVAGSFYKADNVRLSFMNNFHILDIDTVTAGLDLNEEDGRTHYFSSNAYGSYTNDLYLVSRTNGGVFVQNRIGLFDSLYNTSGIRFDSSPYSGFVINYRTSLLYRINEAGLSLKGNLGTGYKDPSLFQLYSSWGSTNLAPETSFGFDSGAEENLFNGVITLEAVYFQNSFSNMIIFDPSQNIYTNEARALTKGLETSLAVKPAGFLELRASYTYTCAIDPSTGKSALFIPRDKAVCDIIIYPVRWISFDLEYIYTGNRDNIKFNPDGSSSHVLMPDYSLVDISLRADLGKFDVYASVDNLFNLVYQDVYGYDPGGFMFNAGIEVKL